MEAQQSFYVGGTVGDKPNFKGPFLRWFVSYNINREKGTCDRLVVFSSGRRHSTFMYLWHKLVWDTLTKQEFFLFITLPEVLGSDKITGFLRSILILPKRTIRHRLNLIERLIGEKETSQIHYQGYKRMKIEILKEQIRLPKTKKFSGYVRNIASLGKNSRGTGIPEPVPFIYEDKVERTNWYYCLTVGEISLLSQVVFLPEEPKEGETVYK